MVDSAYVEMIGRNLGYFERLLVKNEQKSFDVLDDNQDGLYKSIRVAAAIPSMNARAASLFINSYTFIEQRGNYKKWARAAVRIANRFEEDDLYLRCRIVSLLGLLQYECGDLDKAKTSFIASERLAYECEDDAAVANAWYYRAVLDYHTHQPKLSVEWLAKVQEIIVRFPEPVPYDLQRLRGFVFNLLGIIKGDEGAFDHAMDYFEQARAIFVALELHQFVVVADMNISDVLAHQGDIERATNILRSAVIRCGEYGLFVAEVKALLGLAQARGDVKEWQDGLKVVNSIDQIKLMQMGYLGLLARTKGKIAVFLAEVSDFDEAMIQATETIVILKDLDTKFDLSIAVKTLADICLRSGHVEMAETNYMESIRIAKLCENDVRADLLLTQLLLSLEKIKVPG